MFDYRSAKAIQEEKLRQASPQQGRSSSTLRAGLRQLYSNVSSRLPSTGMSRGGLAGQEGTMTMFLLPLTTFVAGLAVGLALVLAWTSPDPDIVAPEPIAGPTRADIETPGVTALSESSTEMGAFSPGFASSLGEYRLPEGESLGGRHVFGSGVLQPE